MEHSSRFSAWFMLTLVAGMLAVAAFNGAVDPYGIYGWTGGLVLQRPKQMFHDRMHKAHEIRNALPDAVLLGTSRTQVGLNPHSPAFHGHANVVVNSALSDGQPVEALRYLQHAHLLRRQKLVVMGLDFLSFNANAKPNPEYADARLEPLLFSSVSDVIPTLMSFAALRASVQTLGSQNQPSYFFSGGQRNTFMMESRVKEAGGTHRNMLHSEEDYLTTLATYQTTNALGHSPPLDALAEIVAFAQKERFALRLFFSPSHARSQLVVDQSGLTRAQDDWKRAVMRSVAQQGAGADVELWDFSGAGVYTAEEVPPAQDTQARMAWFWDSSHYKTELGERVLDRIMGTHPTDVPSSFGVRLKEENLETVLSHIRQEVEGYMLRHADGVAEIAQAARGVAAPGHLKADAPGKPVANPGTTRGKDSG